MEVINIKGIIIKEDLYNESDKLLTILTKEKGLVRVYAKYARKPNRNMLIATSVLSFCEFLISFNDKKGNFLNDATLIESFSQIKNDVIALTFCSHMTELILDSMVDESSAKDTYTLFLYTLFQFTKDSDKFMFYLSVFELKLLFIMGFTPVLDSCVQCKCPVDLTNHKKIRFDCGSGGVVCNKSACQSESYSKIKSISIPTYLAIEYISKSSLDKVFSFRLTKRDENELSDLATEYVCDKFEKCYTKLEMLKDFKI